MTARQLLEQLQKYAQNHPNALDQEIELTIYRGGNTRYNLKGTISGTGWSAGFVRDGIPEYEHLYLSVRKRDLERK